MFRGDMLPLPSGLLNLFQVGAKVFGERKRQHVPPKRRNKGITLRHEEPPQKNMI